ncbi:MAG: type 4a pilus biogenesis protein PilO [Nitrospiraceae bacterium]|nr:type 4a pilus biogenesis protein PilO [Nitrospiraceae bacterium]
MAIKLSVKSLPLYAKAVIGALPVVIIFVVGFMFLISPKQQQIKELDAKIDEQNNKIATGQAKAAKLEILKKENEALVRRLDELKEQLPEEKEISSLLKQVSDLSTTAGLQIMYWRPGPRKNHPSGIVAETPVSVSVTGTYHDFANFLSSLTKLHRIVNVSNIQMGGPQIRQGKAVLQINFTAATFSALEPGK